MHEVVIPKLDVHCLLNCKRNSLKKLWQCQTVLLCFSLCGFPFVLAFFFLGFMSFTCFCYFLVLLPSFFELVLASLFCQVLLLFPHVVNVPLDKFQGALSRILQVLSLHFYQQCFFQGLLFVVLLFPIFQSVSFFL